MKNKIYRKTAAILAVLLILALLPAAGAAQTDEEPARQLFTARTDTEAAGTETNPYLIGTADELERLAEELYENVFSPYSTAYYVLIDDIDLGNRVWMPIGKNSMYAFRGHFDGDGHSVAGLNVSNSGDSTFLYYGLFGCVTDGEIKNLTVSGSIYCNERNAYVGGLSGAVTGNVLIENCVNNVFLSATETDSVGGLVGLYRKSDEIGYEWIDNAVLFRSCANLADIVVGGKDDNPFSQGLAGGILGYSKNCAQFENCFNTGSLNAPNLTAGICGYAGTSQGDHCRPYFQNCYNAGSVTSNYEAHPIYGKGTLSANSVLNCYALDTMAADEHTVSMSEAEMKSDRFAELLTGEGEAWTRSEDRNGGYPYPQSLHLPAAAEKDLTGELKKYKDVLSVPATAKSGDVFSLLQDGELPDDGVAVSCSYSFEDEAEKGLLECLDGAVRLKRENDGRETVTEEIAVRLTGKDGMARKTVKVYIAPKEEARNSLMLRIAQKYSGQDVLDEWAVFDLSALAALRQNGEPALTVSEKAKQNCINLLIGELSQSSALAKDRAKGEIILASVGADTRQLYPVNSAEPFDNAEKLKGESFGSDYTTAIWALLAFQQGNVGFTQAQIGQLVTVIEENLHEDGLFHYRYGLNDFADADSAGWALAALKQFLSGADRYGVQAQAERICGRILAGLSAAQGENGSFGNANSDAMVITGLTALGIDPAADERFVKNGCSLADALMLYVNAGGDGFVSAYLSGEQGENLSRQTTEQGFRGLVALAGFYAQNRKPYNIYAFNIPGEPSADGPRRGTAFATAAGVMSLEPEITEDAGEISVSFEMAVPGGVWVEQASRTVKEGSTVYTLLKDVIEENSMTAEGLEKGYLEAVTKDGTKLAQFGEGEASGWLYYVNGEMPNAGITDYVLKEGDAVRFVYASDYIKEQGNTLDKKPSSPSSDRTSGVKTSGGRTTAQNPVQASDQDSAQPAAPAEESELHDESAEAPQIQYSDVEGHWAKAAIDYVTERGLMNGTGEQFEPDAAMTRAMLVTVLCRMDGAEPVDGDSGFSDVPAGEWYGPAVAWAAENGIVNGVSDTEFAPEDSVSREQTAAILFRYAGFKKYTTEGRADLVQYSDRSAISGWALEAVEWASAAGLMNGTGAHTLDPEGTATRAQIAAVLMRFCENTAK